MIVTTKSIKQVKRNAQDWPTEYVCNFLEAGLVSYLDAGAGIAKLPKSTIVNIMPTFVGKPVVINHIDVTPKDFKDHAVGYITKVWFDDYSGWAYCSFILTDDKAKEKVKSGYSVSCAYDVLKTGPGGEWHAIKYDEEILEGRGTHLALVTSPRYEECRILQNSKAAKITDGEGMKNMVTVRVLNSDVAKSLAMQIIEDIRADQINEQACIDYAKEKGYRTSDGQAAWTIVFRELKNSKGNQKKEDSTMIKLFKKSNDKAGAEVDPKDPTKQKWNADGMFVEIENEMVPLSELAKFAPAKENEYVAIQEVENEMEINGTVHNVADLVKKYQEAKKANSDDEAKKKKEEEEAANKKKNAEDEEKKKKEEEEAANKKNAEEKEKGDKKGEEESTEETIKKNEKGEDKKDIKHFVKLNTARENGGAQSATTMTIDTMHNRVNRGIEKYGTVKK